MNFQHLYKHRSQLSNFERTFTNMVVPKNLYPGTPNGQYASITLEELCLGYEVKNIKIGKNVQKTGISASIPMGASPQSLTRPPHQVKRPGRSASSIREQQCFVCARSMTQTATFLPLRLRQVLGSGGMVDLDAVVSVLRRYVQEAMLLRM